MTDKLKIEQIDEDTIKYNGKEFRAVKEESGVLKIGDVYYTIATTGNISKEGWVNDEIDKARLKAGNVFPTKESAKKSLFYFTLNSEYDYWIPDMELPNDVYEWEWFYTSWSQELSPPSNWKYFVRRKLKSKRRYV